MDIRGIADLATKLAQFPRLGLAQLPTPLEPLKRLAAFLEGPCLWVKRDDATGLGFGGNKLRKLDYVLHEAMAAQADTLDANSRIDPVFRADSGFRPRKTDQ